DGERPCVRELRRDPRGGNAHVGRARGDGADARDGGEFLQLVENLVVPGLEACEHRLELHHLPPSIDSTWPVIHPAASDPKNSTPAAMSSGVPSRFSAILSTSACCCAAP